MQRQSLRLFPAILVLIAVALAIPAAMAQSGNIPQRDEIQEEYTWRLEDIYETTEAWEADFAALEAGLAGFDQYRGHLGESVDNLVGCLNLYDSLDLILSDLYVYAHMKVDQDQRIDAAQEMAGRISQLYGRYSAATSFIQPEILAIPGDRLQSFLNSAPELDVWHFYLEDMTRTKDHILSEKEEEILALAGPAVSSPGNIFEMINNADISYGTIVDDDGNEIELTKERYYKILETGSRAERQAANQAYNKAYLQYENTLASTLAASVKRDHFYTKARKYETTLERKLNGDNIPTEVFHNLIDAVNANLEPLHKWTSIRKRILGYDTLYTYDLSVPLTPDPSKEYTYEEAKAVILNGLKPMGERYLADLEMGLNSRWVDVYETEGKRSGAYSWGSYQSHPYVLMNYSGTLDNVFTLAHEMGHAMHSYYTNANEPNIYAGHYTFTAEVASTCNEAVLMKYLLEQTEDKTEKMILLNHYIEQIIGTFYTQMMFSEFELAIHERIEEGNAISADYLRQTYRDIYQKYWGPELVIDSVNDLGCMRIPHFYSAYYVYQYASSYAAAQAISQRIMQEGDGYLDTYMKFLATGRSDYPVQILNEAGVDFSTPEPINRTIQLFAELVDEMERLLNEG